MNLFAKGFILFCFILAKASAETQSMQFYTSFADCVSSKNYLILYCISACSKIKPKPGYTLNTSYVNFTDKKCPKPNTDPDLSVACYCSFSSSPAPNRGHTKR